MKLRVAHLKSGKCPKKYKQVKRHGRKNCILKPSYREMSGKKSRSSMGSKKGRKSSLGSRKGRKSSLGSKKRK